jgi:hypothetical protein
MSDLIHDMVLSCPWCGSPTEMTVDCSAGSHELIEDCQVCCSPILIRAECDPLSGELLCVTAVRENA